MASQPTAILLMGPTASGKTERAISLCKRFPCDVISVDSAMVYRGMDIGTAKPDAETLRRTPHRLIDIREPEDSYSAGDFVRDARAAMQDILAAGRIPLLVGGTMMYFRALTGGLADLPSADPGLREAIDAEAAASGWPALHAELSRVDPAAAGRISPNDSQRIQRAIEVYRATGKPLSDWQQDADARPPGIRFLRIALTVEPRETLHARIAARLRHMVERGFVAEVATLRDRPGLTADSPSMRAVGYRQFWEHLEGTWSLDEASERALFATRQLAKRQLTWLRSEPSLFSVDALESDAIDVISGILARHLD